VAGIPLGKISAGEALVEFSLEAEGDVRISCLLGEPMIFSPTDEEEDTPPNIILISLDTLRADHLGCYGYSRNTSPTIDRIAQEGVRFTHAFSQSSFTLPSHKSFLTGYYPHLMTYLAKSYDLSNRALPPGVPTLATYLKSAGYVNCAFTSSGYVSSAYGFFKEFDFYSELRSYAVEKVVNGRIIKRVGFNYAHDWLKQHKTHSPFFIFLHTYSIHSSYAAPERYDDLYIDNNKSNTLLNVPTKTLKEYNLSLNGNQFSKNPQGDPSFKVSDEELRGIIAAYDRGIKWTDDEICTLYNLLESLNLLDNTIIIIVSDHGEEFLEHNFFLHTQMYEEVLHVPFIIRYPDNFIVN